MRKRNAATLIPIIQERISRNARIISDGWRAYSGLRALGFNHEVVNHSVNFVTPEDSTVHTQNIENLWRCLRRFLNGRTSYSRQHLRSYIAELTFKRLYVDHFDTIVSAIELKFHANV